MSISSSLFFAAMSSLLFVHTAVASFCAYGKCYRPMNLTNAVLTTFDAVGNGYDVESDCDGGSVHGALLDDDPNTCCKWREADTYKVGMVLTLADADIDVFTLAQVQLFWQRQSGEEGPGAVPAKMYDPIQDRNNLVQMVGNRNTNFTTANDYTNNYTWYGSELILIAKVIGQVSYQICELNVLFTEASLPTTTVAPTTTTVVPTTTTNLATFCAYGTCYRPMNETNVVLTAVDGDAQIYDVDGDCDGGSAHSALLDDDPNTCCNWRYSDTWQVIIQIDPVVADSRVIFDVARAQIKWTPGELGPEVVYVQMHEPRNVVPMEGNSHSNFTSVNDYTNHHTWNGSVLVVAFEISTQDTFQVCDLSVLFTELVLPTTTPPPTTTGLSCSIDLASLFDSWGDTGRVTVQCDEGCDDCSFILDKGVFTGDLECLPNVPCFVEITTDYDYSITHTTLDGSLASVLYVTTSNRSRHSWSFSEIYAPANGGDFHFETSNSILLTKFYAENSGVVKIVVREHDRQEHESVHTPEMSQMQVYASTAEELHIHLCENTLFGWSSNSSHFKIECPAEGKCVWQSSAQRYTEDPTRSMNIVKLFTYPGTDLQLLCDNSIADACAGVKVALWCERWRWCDLQYDGDWQCVGSLDLTDGCPEITTTTVPPTTTITPTTTTVTPTTTTTPTTTASAASTATPTTTPQLTKPQPSDSGCNDWNLSHVLIFVIGTVACLCL